ncbi:16S rRNA processing protein RimM [bacterium]|nr:16S rRNA processing protein RimM [bacterium]
MGEKNVDLVPVGRVTRAHGIKGEIKVVPEGISAERLLSLQRVCLEGAGKRQWFEVAEIRRQPSMLIVKLRGVTDRTAAETWRGCSVSVTRDDLPAAAEGELESVDIEGFRVETVTDAYVGTVREVMETAGQDLLVIDAGGREVLVPAVDYFVKVIDAEKRLIRIDPIDGLLDINES